MSLVSLVLTDEPTGIVRVMRALRVLRIFGRLKSLRKILSALALALVPVCQVFLILFILLCIGTFASRMCHSVFLFAKNPEFRACPFSSFFILSPYLFAVKRVFAGAVVGVAMFSGVAPDNFAVFDRAFLTLFYVTGGDPWPDALHKVRPAAPPRHRAARRPPGDRGRRAPRARRGLCTLYDPIPCQNPCSGPPHRAVPGRRLDRAQPVPEPLLGGAPATHSGAANPLPALLRRRSPRNPSPPSARRASSTRTGAPTGSSPPTSWPTP